MAAVMQKTRDTTLRLESLGYRVIELWEHEFKKMKTGEAAEFLKTHHLEERLIPREAFFGGRTNAVQLYYEGRAKYVDFTSLYPWVSFLQ